MPRRTGKLDGLEVQFYCNVKVKEFALASSALPLSCLRK